MHFPVSLSPPFSLPRRPELCSSTLLGEAQPANVCETNATVLRFDDIKSERNREEKREEEREKEGERKDEMSGMGYERQLIFCSRVMTFSVGNGNVGSAIFK